jgi:hypothetical protein
MEERKSAESSRNERHGTLTEETILDIRTLKGAKTLTFFRQAQLQQQRKTRLY